MANKKFKLVPHNARACPNAPAVLRNIMKDLKQGRATGVSFAVVYRDGTAYSYSEADCPIRQLGAVELLKQKIITKDMIVT